MSIFSWQGQRREPPRRWDLRMLGWTLAPPDESDVHLIDLSHGCGDNRSAGPVGERNRSDCLYIGVDAAIERAELLEAGAGDAVASGATAEEIAVRAQRIAESHGRVSRLRSVGPLTLDLVHRDARLADGWLTLHPREFELLWRLAERPGECVSRMCLLREVWRLEFEPGTNTVEVHVSRLRAKLAAAGVRDLVETVPEGGYRVSTGTTQPTSLAEERLCA